MRTSCHTYCTSTGRSSPYSSRTRAIASGPAWEPGPPRIASVGAPPAARRAKNTVVATTQATRSAAPTRPASHRSAVVTGSRSIRELGVDECRGRDGAQRGDPLHAPGEEVILLVVQRQDVE